jgi:cell division inhibitor SepF
LNSNPISLKIITPKVYDDAREITEFLMNGNTVLLNLDGINRELAIRILDYLRGALQVVGGMMTKVGKTTLVVAPKNVDVSSIEAMVGGSEG